MRREGIRHHGADEPTDMNEYIKSKVEAFQYREPGPIAKEQMWRYRKARSVGMDHLRKTPDGRCAWCNVTRITDRRRKYCTDDCSQSAYFYSYPQNPAAKAWRLIEVQACACVGCGLDYTAEIERRIQGIEHYNDRMRKQHPDWFKADKVTYYRLGYNTGEKWHVDHINPLFKGGDGIGMDNVQVLCVECHKRKTVEERR